MELALLPHQRWLTERDEEWAALVTGYGAGKSHGGAAAFFLLCMRNPGTEGLIVAPTFRTLSAVCLPAFEKVSGAYIRDWNKNECWYELLNGTRVWWASADNPSSFEGFNVSQMWIDEAQELAPEAWRVASGRLRVPAPKCQGLITATPLAGTWLQKEFDSGKPNRAYRRATSFDNPFNRAGWAESLRSTYSQAEAEAYIEGRWTTQSGLVYPEFSRDTHLIDYRPDKHLPVLVGIDFGYRWPAVLFAQRAPERLYSGARPIPQGAIIVFDEDVIEGVSTTQLAQRIVERCRGFQIGACYVDPAGSMTGQAGADHAGPTEVQTLEGAFRDAGISPRVDFLPLKGNSPLRSINAGVEKVRAWLRNARGDMRLFFSRDLERQHQGDQRGILRGLSQYQWRSDLAVPLKAKEPNNVHHVMDALRYLVRHIALEDESGRGVMVRRYV